MHDGRISWRGRESDVLVSASERGRSGFGWTGDAIYCAHAYGRADDPPEDLPEVVSEEARHRSAAADDRIRAVPTE